MQNLIPLIPFLPFIGFLINGLFGKKLPKNIVAIIGSGSILAAFLIAVGCFNEIHHTGAAIHSHLYTWLQVGGFRADFAFQIDQLSAWMMLIITGVGFLIHVYSAGYMHDDDGFWKFFAYLNLFIFSMLLLVMGDNFLMMFFGWEGVGLCSYLLIGFWFENRDYGVAARKAFIMNRIGDLGLLIAIFMIYNTFGSITYSEIFPKLATMRLEEWLLTTICLLLFVGACGKSAQIPLYTWLPDAMAGPTPVSALIHAATMVTAGVYLICRCNLLFNLAPFAQHLILIIGLLTAVFTAIIGLRQNDIKKVLAYSTVSQLGLMFAALGVGAYSSAMFHVTTHAFFKALLFLAAGSVIHGMGGEQDMRKMGGLRKAMPITFWVFLIGTLAISGFPLLSGFFSKDEIFAHIFSEAGGVYWGIAGLGAFLTAIYMCRLMYVTFFGEFRGTHEQAHHLHESPLSMTLPLVILAVLAVGGGFLNVPHFLHLGNPEWLAHWFSPVMAVSEMHLSSATEWTLMSFTTSLALVVLAASYFIYSKKENLPVADLAQNTPTRLIANKFYVDEIYHTIFVQPIERGSKMLHYYFDTWAIDGVVNGVGASVQRLGGVFRRLQNGNIEYYLLGMVTGVILLLAVLFF